MSMYDPLRWLRPVNYYNEKAIWSAINSQRSYNSYAGKTPAGGSLYKVTLPDNSYTLNEVYVEIRSMGGYPYIAGVYKKKESFY